MVLLLLALIVVQYFTARASLNTLVFTLEKFLPRSIVFGIISLLFFPGTVVHELAHAITAVCLLLPVRSIHLIPEWDHKSIHLGHVTYEKRGLWRSIIVGLAPLPFGMVALWVVLQWHLPVWLTGYLMFVISSTMFSSKSDLVDAIYIIPLVIVLGVVWFFFPTAVAGPVTWLLTNAQPYITIANTYVMIAIGIHVVIIGVGFLLGLVF